MKMRKTVTLLGIVSLLATIISGCDRIPTVNQANPKSVQIIRNVKSMKPLNVTISNSNMARKLYNDIRALKPFPNGSMSCPADFGVNYTLKFKNGSRNVLTANADPNGCREVHVSTGKNVWAVNQTGQRFWTDLTKSLGLKNVSDLGGAQP